MDNSGNSPLPGGLPVKILDADGLYVEEVMRARRQPQSSKLIAGIELFELACEVAKAGIRR